MQFYRIYTFKQKCQINAIQPEILIKMISNQAFNPNHAESVLIRIKADQIFNSD